MASRGESAGRYQLSLPLFDEDLNRVGTLLDTSIATEVILLSDAMSTYIPYQTELPTMAIAPYQPIAICWQRSYRIEFIDPVTGSRWATEIAIEPRPVSRELRERAYVRWDEQGLGERARRNLKFGPHLPFTGGMRWDTDGRLWVGDYVLPDETLETYNFNVFSREGAWLFSQGLPVRPSLITEDGFFVSTEDDEGNPVVQFYRRMAY